MMKKLILIALACSISALLLANNNGETRTATVKVGISSSDQINIQAKYTELVIETWDKNEVEIVASVRYDGKMTNKIETFLQEFEQHVKDNIYKGAGELKISTNLDLPNRVQIGSKNVGINISFGDDELKVSYKIKAPGSNKYIVASSYEDVRMIGDFNSMDFTQYSGDIEAENIQSAKMNLKYGSATIKSIETASMELYEQELNVGEIGSLEINAKYSDLEFKTAKTIDALSYESDFQIGTIGELKGNFKYGEINISGTLDQSRLIFYEMDMEAKEVGSIQLENSKYSKFDFEKAGSIEFLQSYEDETRIGSLGTFKSLNSKYGNHSIGILRESVRLNAYEDELDIDQLGNNASEVLVDGKYIDLSIATGSSAFILISNVKYGDIEYDKSSVDIKRYIKDNDQLEIEAYSKTKSQKPVNITVKGYEVDLKLN